MFTDFIADFLLNWKKFATKKSQLPFPTLDNYLKTSLYQKIIITYVSALNTALLDIFVLYPTLILLVLFWPIKCYPRHGGSSSTTKNIVEYMHCYIWSSINRSSDWKIVQDNYKIFCSLRFKITHYKQATSKTYKMWCLKQNGGLKVFL